MKGRLGAARATAATAMAAISTSISGAASAFTPTIVQAG
jgi:hypothetical protein